MKWRIEYKTADGLEAHDIREMGEMPLKIIKRRVWQQIEAYFAGTFEPRAIPEIQTRTYELVDFDFCGCWCKYKEVVK